MTWFILNCGGNALIKNNYQAQILPNQNEPIFMELWTCKTLLKNSFCDSMSSLLKRFRQQYEIEPACKVLLWWGAKSK
jgi:hypothetical protein